MASTLKIFNNQMITFANILTTRFPENSQLSLAVSGLETLSSCNPKKTIELFTMYVYQYREKIMEKQEEFILRTNFINDNYNDVNATSKYATEMMVSLKNNWGSLNLEEKENIWKFLQVLVKLTDKYISENTNILNGLTETN